LAKFKYNAITIYDEKQRKDTGIEKQIKVYNFKNDQHHIEIFNDS